MSRKRKRMAVAGVIALGACMAFMSMGAFGADTANVSVTAAVPATIQLTMPTTAVNFGGGSLTPGTVYNQDITASVNSNKGWSLMVYKNHDLLGELVGGETIPSANLTYTSTGGGKITNSRGSATQFTAPSPGAYVVQGTRGSNIGTTISYSLDVPWELAPDTYSATHTYTATQP